MGGHQLFQSVGSDILNVFVSRTLLYADLFAAVVENSLRSLCREKQIKLNIFSWKNENSTHCPPLLSHQEQRIVDILNRIATISCGSFGIVQMTTEAAACPAGCKVWSVSCPKPLLDVSANPVHRFFVHLSMNSENQLYLRSSDSTTYLNLPREHQPVLLSRTLQLNKCPHEPGNPLLGKFGDADEYRYESVPIYDIIDLGHASRHQIHVGDKVLTRQIWPGLKSEQNQKGAVRNIRSVRYLPATVIEKSSSEEKRVKKCQPIVCFPRLPLRPIQSAYSAEENRSHFHDSNSSINLLIELAMPGPRASCYKLSKADVVWIPTAVFERIMLEQLLPAKAREWVHQKTFPPGIYPNMAAPGYPQEDSSRLSFWRNSLAVHPIQYVQFQSQPEKQVRMFALSRHFVKLICRTPSNHTLLI
ncbi:hypothetical protein FBUS_08755 [Fasciolopsis buskii]|uniref:Uncharacterized protein n=1 Tax=Fasciolopsis buskii TaxID=27845 RepID=A0A8E0RKR0_9TREM|nr:hypothetical protein FBUS_08755 [Fasciolopsis buski]